MARCLKFRVGADQLRGYRQADLRLFFAYANNRFSHNEAQIKCYYEESPYPVQKSTVKLFMSIATIFDNLFLQFPDYHSS